MKNFIGSVLVLFFSSSLLYSQIPSQPDSTVVFTPSSNQVIQNNDYRPLTNSWGADIAFSNNGFGIGGFFKHEVTDNLSWSASLIISGAKDPTEMDSYDYWGNSFVYWKKNRLLMIPIHASVEYRLFKDDITDSFRPFITAGAGPTMMFVSPYASSFDSTYLPGYPNQIDFFTSLKYGTLKYTLGGFVGGGAYFGFGKNTVAGVSIRYYFATFPDPIEVLADRFIKDFGGIVIMLHFGSLF